VSPVTASGRAMTRILILGGTAEARLLAGRLAGRTDLDVTLSLAGRTASPAPAPVPVRRGGFGGAAGLADYLSREGISALIDATHPYAQVISANAVAAARKLRIPFVALARPPWSAVAGDRWTEAADVPEAVRMLGPEPRNVFVTLGRTELAPFKDAPWHHYLVRSVDPVEPPLPVPHAAYVTGRGPFDEAGERKLLAQHRIDVIIAKNSGGAATYGKLAAARSLGVAVITLARPARPLVPAAASVEEVLARLDHALASMAVRGV
jgi:precorrin-6A/cobalt-precorrin-6A reductase